MAAITGSVRVGGFIAPTDTADTYAAQSEVYNLGGYRSVADAAERLAITPGRRKEGMLVKQVDTGDIWTLTGGILDANWAVQSFSGGETYTNASAIEVAHGGIDVGDTFAAVPLSTLLDTILYPYVAPTFTSFDIQDGGVSWPVSAGDPVEVGATLAANPTYSWAIDSVSKVAALSVDLDDTTTPLAVASGLDPAATPYVSTQAALTYNVPHSHNFVVSATDTDPDGPNTFSSTLTYDWLWRYYAGTDSASTLNEAGIKGLWNYADLTDTVARTYNFAAASGEYKYIAYPLGSTAPTTFKDTQTGMNVPFQLHGAGNISVTNAEGVAHDYVVYRSVNQLSAAMDIEVGL